MRPKQSLWVIAIAVLVGIGPVDAPAAEGDAVWQPLAEEIAQILDEVEVAYGAGDAKAARRGVIRAYFGVFEDRKMEAAMRMTIGAKHTYKVEKKFGALRKAIKKGAGADEIKAIGDDLRAALRRDAKVLDEAGIPAEVFKVNQ